MTLISYVQLDSMDDTNWTEEFVKLYFSNDREKRNQVYEMLCAHRPKVFCTYMNSKHSEDFIATFQLCYSDAKNFSDTFDAR